MEEDTENKEEGKIEKRVEVEDKNERQGESRNDGAVGPEGKVDSKGSSRTGLCQARAKGPSK